MFRSQKKKMQLDVEVSPPANALLTCNLQTNKYCGAINYHEVLKIQLSKASKICVVQDRLPRVLVKWHQTDGRMDRQKAMHMSPLCISTGVLKQLTLRGRASLKTVMSKQLIHDISRIIVFEFAQNGLNDIRSNILPNWTDEDLSMHKLAANRTISHTSSMALSGSGVTHSLMVGSMSSMKTFLPINNLPTSHHTLWCRMTKTKRWQVVITLLEILEILMSIFLHTKSHPGAQTTPINPG